MLFEILSYDYKKGYDCLLNQGISRNGAMQPTPQLARNANPG